MTYSNIAIITPKGGKANVLAEKSSTSCCCSRRPFGVRLCLFGRDNMSTMVSRGGLKKCRCVYYRVHGFKAPGQKFSCRHFNHNSPFSFLSFPAPTKLKNTF